MGLQQVEGQNLCSTGRVAGCLPGEQGNLDCDQICTKIRPYYAGNCQCNKCTKQNPGVCECTYFCPSSQKGHLLN